MAPTPTTLDSRSGTRALPARYARHRPDASAWTPRAFLAHMRALAALIVASVGSLFGRVRTAQIQVTGWHLVLFYGSYLVVVAAVVAHLLTASGPR